MEFADFAWKGQLASSMGIVVTEQVGYIRPAERVEQVEVPGRSGLLTLQSTPSWDTVVYGPQCALRPGSDLDRVWGWLQGSGAVVFGSMPLHAFDARLINQIDFRYLFQGDRAGYMTFSPIFACEPLRRLADGDATIEIANGQSLTNPGTVASRPLLRLVGEGDVTLVVAGQAVELDELNGGILLDCEAQDAFSLDKGMLLNNKMTGDFPTLPTGTSFISWTGTVTSVTLTPRWRWL